MCDAMASSVEDAALKINELVCALLFCFSVNIMAVCFRKRTQIFCFNVPVIFLVVASL